MRRLLLIAATSLVMLTSIVGTNRASAAASAADDSLAGVLHHRGKPKVDEEFRDAFDEKLLFNVESPTDVVISPDGDIMLVTSKEGKLWAVKGFDEEGGEEISSPPTPKLALAIKDICINVERGLNGVAFHPKFRDNRWIYLYYTYNRDHKDCNADGSEKRGPVNRLSRFVLRRSDDDDDAANLDDEQVFFNTPVMPYGDDNAGQIAFGNDGYLYVSVGDGGKIGKTNDVGIPYPQALDMLLGKILRLTDTGGIPEDNPYVADDSTSRCNETGWSPSSDVKCREIFSYGLRNPFRFAMDPNGGGTRFFINDVGMHTWESIHEGGDMSGGVNFGYPYREGPCELKMDTGCKPPDPSSRISAPVHWFHHEDEGGDAITGGAFVPDDNGWPDSFRGSYIYANYAFGGLYVISDRGDGCPYPECDPPISNYTSSTKILSELGRVVSIAFGPYHGNGGRHALYVATRGDTGKRGNAAIYRISYVGSEEEKKKRSPKAIVRTNGTIGFLPLVVNFDGSRSFDPNGLPLVYAWDFDGDGVADSASSTASFRYKASGSFVATLTVQNSEGRSDTASVRIEVDGGAPRAKIVSPEEGTLYAVGDTFTLIGSAVDAEGGNLPDASLTWEVRLQHEDQFVQILDPTQGNNLELPGAPGPITFDTAPTSYLVVLLTATDSRGVSSKISTVLWSDGGKQSHEYTVPAAAGGQKSHDIVAAFLHESPKATGSTTQATTHATPIVAVATVVVALATVLVGWAQKREGRKSGAGKEQMDSNGAIERKGSAEADNLLEEGS